MEFQGLQISIENRKGSVRSGVAPDGKKWSTKMTFDYGYARGTQGVDGDHVDVFLGPNPNAKMAYVVHTKKPPDFKVFDEDKCFLGFDSAEAAKKAFYANYDRKEFFGGMDAIAMPDFIRKVNRTKDNPKKLVASAVAVLACFLAIHAQAQNLKLTPGVVRLNNAKVVCKIAWGKDRRHVTQSMKTSVCAEYGVGSADCVGAHYEIDHLVPRELGGADDVKNLWPQPWVGEYNAHDKDWLENRLHRDVCAGTMTLKTAQHVFMTDWRIEYKRLRK